MEECLICEELLADDDVSRVQEKDLKRLISSSIERGEKSHDKKFKSADIVNIHRTCWRQYNNERSIAAAKRRGSAGTLTSNLSEHAELQVFDFKNFCFICAQAADANFVKQQMKNKNHLRRVVSLVSTDSARDTVLKLLKLRKKTSFRSMFLLALKMFPV